MNYKSNQIIMHKEVSMNNEKIKDEEQRKNLDPQEGPFAGVSVKAGCTVNLGDFNSGRVDIMLYMPCQPNDEEVEQTYNKIKDWVDNKVSEEYKELIEAKGN